MVLEEESGSRQGGAVPQSYLLFIIEVGFKVKKIRLFVPHGIHHSTAGSTAWFLYPTVT